MHHNRRYHHLLDPETGAPRATSQRSVSVIAPACMAADAGATVVFGTPRSRAEAILKTHDARIAHSI